MVIAGPIVIHIPVHKDADSNDADIHPNDHVSKEDPSSYNRLITLQIIEFKRIENNWGRGGLSIRSGSGGLKDKAVAGNPSVTKLTYVVITIMIKITQSNYMELKASGSPIKELRKMLTTSPILDEIM